MHSPYIALGELVAITSVWPSALIAGCLVTGATVAVSRSGFYSGLIASEVASDSRFHSVDGLRGFLAIAVFFHHAVISYFCYVHGRWELPPSRFYANLGQAGVATFFMITAFLFWNKGLSRSSDFRALPFFWSRLTRLVPMYVVSALSVVLIATALTKFEMRQPLAELIRSLVSWLSFAFIDPIDFNGYPDTWKINGVFWSLRYEWLFYLFLPLGLLFSRGFGFLLLFILCSVVIGLFSTQPVEWFFLAGALVAVVCKTSTRMEKLDWNSIPATFFVVAAVGYALFFSPEVFGVFPAALLCASFLCIARGNDVFGLLKLKPSRFLGVISYSLYLTHCIVLFLVFHALDRLTPIDQLTPWEFWAVVALCAVLTVLLSSVTYKFVEHPWMHKKKPSWL